MSQAIMVLYIKYYSLAMDNDLPKEFQIAHVATALGFLHFSVIVAAVAVHSVHLNHLLFFNQSHVLPQNIHSYLEAFL